MFEKIINELRLALEKLKIDQLSEILSYYSEGKEEALIEDLMEFNTHYSPDEDEIPKYHWLKFGNYRLPLNQVYNICTEDTYDINLTRMIYKIIINKDVETKNTVVKDLNMNFNTEEERNKEIKALETKLYQFNIVFV